MQKVGIGISGVYKTLPEDFIVTEQLGFELDGSGEHEYLLLRRSGRNTHDIQRQLAQLADVPRHHVGYAGLKDKQGLCSQWFSVHLPGKDGPDWQVLLEDGYEILEQTRHRAKLRTGANKGNHFELVLRDLSGDQQAISDALTIICEQGFPNAFGEQRFGINGSNLESIREVGDGPLPKRKSNRYKLLLSAARSWLFNELLARRVADGSWNQIMPGEVVCLAGSQSFFGPVEPDDELNERLGAFDIHPSGPMAGTGGTQPSGELAALEASVLADNPDIAGYIERTGVKAARRPLRSRAADMQWQFMENSSLKLSFQLGSGCYATSLLAALGDFHLAGKNAGFLNT